MIALTKPVQLRLKIVELTALEAQLPVKPSRCGREHVLPREGADNDHADLIGADLRRFDCPLRRIKGKRRCRLCCRHDEALADTGLLDDPLRRNVAQRRSAKFVVRVETGPEAASGAQDADGRSTHGVATSSKPSIRRIGAFRSLIEPNVVAPP